MHVHVHRANGEAKFWIEPNIELATNYGLTSRQLAIARELIEKNENEIRKAWESHFPG